MKMSMEETLCLVVQYREEIVLGSNKAENVLIRLHRMEW